MSAPLPPLPPLPLLLSAAAGGALGASLRLCVSWIVHNSTRLGAMGPYAGTALANLIGCFLIGWLLGSERMVVGVLGQEPTTSVLRTFAIVGVLGGFTTFSAFGYETFTLLQESQWGKAALYVALQILVGVAAVYAGSRLA